MRPLILAVISAVFLLFTSQAEACDSFGPNGWTCSKPSGLFNKSNYKKKAIKRYRKRTTKRYRKRTKMARKKTRRAIDKKRKTVTSRSTGSGHRLVRATSGTVGRNPTGRRYLWCQDYINQSLRKAGLRGTGSRTARSSLRIGRRVSNPRAGDLGVMPRGRRGGHVGIVLAVKSGQVLLRGGNQCGRRGRRTVCDRWVSRRRFIGFRRV